MMLKIRGSVARSSYQAKRHVLRSCCFIHHVLCLFFYAVWWLIHIIVIVCYILQEVEINHKNYEVMLLVTFSLARKCTCWCQSLADVLMIPTPYPTLSLLLYVGKYYLWVLTNAKNITEIIRFKPALRPASGVCINVINNGVYCNDW
jgi:hypothetical protein